MAKPPPREVGTSRSSTSQKRPSVAIAIMPTRGGAAAGNLSAAQHADAARAHSLMASRHSEQAAKLARDQQREKPPSRRSR